MNSTNLQFIIDYIYHGEVQIYQEQLDPFLDVAEKLKVSGLISEPNQESFSDSQPKPNNPKILQSTSNESDTLTAEENIAYEYESEANVCERKIALTVSTENESEVDAKVSEILEKNGDNFVCTVCSKVGKHRYNMTRHVQTHIGGLSYPCNTCDKTFRSKNSLQKHSYLFHKSG